LPRLTCFEKRVLCAIPDLWPDCDSDDLPPKLGKAEAISYALTTLLKFDLISASEHEGMHPLAPYYRDVELTPAGIDLQRDLARNAVLRFLTGEWRWIITSVFTALSLTLSLWNFYHSK
jgi:hypothetical protein